MVARIMPVSWHWPERIASRTVREPTLWDAGIRMMRAENPGALEFIIEAAEIRRRNRDVIEACKEKGRQGQAARTLHDPDRSRPRMKFGFRSTVTPTNKSMTWSKMTVLTDSNT